MSNEVDETTVDSGDPNASAPAPGLPIRTTVARARAPAARQAQTVPSIPGFQVLGKLGEGGMGVVWRAIQLSTKRPVALKLMSAAGFGSGRARARFEREVELTAKLDHPHIARLYESGLLQGVCFYAMELIAGRRLGDFVKQRNLSRIQIIDLMKAICRAVQYAHQKGIIHRDLKPSNILVDEEGQPHVLDFGLAKATQSDQQLSVDGEVAGTPAFMSPEQASGKADALDTRSDVYTLGVILFNLISGQFPHDISGSHLQVMKRISDEEPRRLKQIEPKADRELEVLLVKALAKEPERRYGTAGELADDLDRYLKHEPLNAQLPTIGYLLRKKAVRYRVPAALALGVCAVLLATVVWAYVRISKERNSALAATAAKDRQVQETERQRERAEANALRSARSEAEARKEAAIAEAVSRFQGEMLAAADPRQSLGDKVTVLQATQGAIARLDAGSLKDQPLVEARVRYTIGGTLEALGRNDDAEAVFRRALKIVQKELPPGDPLIGASLNNLANVLRRQNKLGDAERLFREALEIDRKALPAGHPYIATCLTNLALVLEDQNKPAEAETFSREALGICRQALPAGHPDIATSLNNLAFVLKEQNKLAEAEGLFREALSIFRKALPAGHPYIANTLHNLALVLQGRNELAEAELLFREALEIRRKALPAGHPDIGRCLNNLGLVLRMQNKLGEAEAMYREALPILRHALPAGHPNITATLTNIGTVLRLQNRLAEAEPFLREAQAIQVKNLATNHRAATVPAQAPPSAATGGIEFSRDKAAAAGPATPSGVPEVAALEASADAMEKLVAAFPDNEANRIKLAHCYANIGILHRNARHFDASLKAERRALDLRAKLAAAKPDDLQRQSWLGASYNNYGVTLEALGKPQEALQNYQSAIEHQQIAFDAAPAVQQYRSFLRNHYANIGRVQVSMKNPAKASAAALKSVELLPRDAGSLLSAAQQLAMCAALAGNQPGSAPQNPSARRRYATQAIQTLRQALDAGYAPREALDRDTAFDGIRNDPEFQKLLHPAKDE